jgi:hypothetical protein
MRRDPQTIVTAHRMDPARKEVYVEGRRDRLFLNWLTGRCRGANARVADIDIVDLPGFTVGGARARLLEFARIVGDTPARILCFADADADRLRGQPSAAPNLILTDGRDLESYVLDKRCLQKVLRVGLGNESVEVETLFNQLVDTGKRLGAIRLMSDSDELNLPFQRTRLERYVTFAGGSVRVDYRSYLQTLLQNGSISITRLDALLNRAEEVLHSHEHHADLVHGKDASRVAEAVLRQISAGSADATQLLWCAFEEAWAISYPNLAEVVSFLCTD